MPKPLATWQIWHAFKHHLGESFLVKVFGKRNGRTIRMYAQDPKFTDDRCNDPIENLHTVFSEMAAIGRPDVVRKAIGYLVTALGDENQLDEISRLQPTLCEEILADYRAVSVLQRAIEDGEEIDLVDTLKLSAIEEIERTFAKYIQK